MGILRLGKSAIGALFGHGPMSDLSPLSEEERKSNFGAAKTVDRQAAGLAAPSLKRPASEILHLHFPTTGSLCNFNAEFSAGHAKIPANVSHATY